jgi:hypothetical protein
MNTLCTQDGRSVLFRAFGRQDSQRLAVRLILLVKLRGKHLAGSAFRSLALIAAPSVGTREQRAFLVNLTSNITASGWRVIH